MALRPLTAHEGAVVWFAVETFIEGPEGVLDRIEHLAAAAARASPSSYRPEYSPALPPRRARGLRIRHRRAPHIRDALVGAKDGRLEELDVTGLSPRPAGLPMLDTLQEREVEVEPLIGRQG